MCIGKSVDHLVLEAPFDEGDDLKYSNPMIGNQAIRSEELLGLGTAYPYVEILQEINP